jgi:SAM-dependent methyltransferase
MGLRDGPATEAQGGETRCGDVMTEPSRSRELISANSERDESNLPYHRAVDTLNTCHAKRRGDGPTMAGFVGAQHEFHNAAFVQGWAERFVPTQPRILLFDLILSQIEGLQIADVNILELGIGPGYMARHILDRNKTFRYEGLDFSDVFFDVARRTLGDRSARVTLTKADLMDQSWPTNLARQPHAIISTWALHDLGSQEAVASVYARCFETLPKGGILVNGDFIKPDGTGWDYEPGRFDIARHLELLRAAGFANPLSLKHFEREIEQPTAAQNYACMVATK